MCCYRGKKCASALIPQRWNWVKLFGWSWFIAVMYIQRFINEAAHTNCLIIATRRGWPGGVTTLWRILFCIDAGIFIKRSYLGLLTDQKGRFNLISGYFLISIISWSGPEQSVQCLFSPQVAGKWSVHFIRARLFAPTETGEWNKFYQSKWFYFPFFKVSALRPFLKLTRHIFFLRCVLLYWHQSLTFTLPLQSYGFYELPDYRNINVSESD